MRKLPSGISRVVPALLGTVIVAGHVQAETPAARPWALPAEVDFDQGATGGDAIIARFLPVNTLLVREDWRLVNVAVFVVGDAPGGRPGAPGNPEPVPGPNVFGLGDLTDAVLYTRKTSENMSWGVGAVVGEQLGRCLDRLLAARADEAHQALRQHATDAAGGTRNQYR